MSRFLVATIATVVLVVVLALFFVAAIVSSLKQVEPIRIVEIPVPVASTPVRLPDDVRLAAIWDTPGSGPGQLRSPAGIAVDGSGSVYVADVNNDRVQVFNTGGEFLREWSSRRPVEIAVDGSGNVYVGDSARVQVFTAGGEFLTKWGSLGSGNGQFRSLTGIAVDGSGHVYVADSGDSRVQVFTASGEFLREWGSRGLDDGQFLGHFGGIIGIAVDGSGRVYVADSGNRRVQVFTTSGEFLGKWGDPWSDDVQFLHPSLIAVDGPGHVYVGDTARVQVFTASGEFLTKWGSLGSGDGQFRNLTGIAVDGSGRVYVSDADDANNRVQVFSVELPTP